MSDWKNLMQSLSAAYDEVYEEVLNERRGQGGRNRVPSATVNQNRANLSNALFGRRTSGGGGQGNKGMRRNPRPSSSSSSNSGSGMSDAQINTASRTAATQRRAGQSADLRGGGGGGSLSTSSGNAGTSRSSSGSKVSSGSSGSGGGSRVSGGSSGGGSRVSSGSSGGSSSSAPAAKAKVRDYGSKSANMSAWAKANPKLAAKVKPGQSGYKAIQSTTSSPASGAGRQALSMGSKSSPSSSSASSSMSSAKSAGSSSSSSGMSGIKSPRLASALNSVTKIKSENYENLIGYLMDEGFANNEVSADVILTHMSDDWLESLLSE